MTGTAGAVQQIHDTYLQHEICRKEWDMYKDEPELSMPAAGTSLLAFSSISVFLFTCFTVFGAGNKFLTRKSNRFSLLAFVLFATIHNYFLSHDYCYLANVGRADRNIWNILTANATHPRRQHKRAIVWVDSNRNIIVDLTFSQFYAKIKQVAYFLQTKLSLKINSKVLLCYMPGVDFLYAFWACIALKLVPVPIVPADPFQPNSDTAVKMGKIKQDCKAAVMLSTSEYVQAIEAAKVYLQSMASHSAASSASSPSNSAASLGPSFRAGVTSQAAVQSTEFDLFKAEFVCTDDFRIDDGWKSMTFPQHHPNGLTMAFLQYTSGSTGSPKVSLSIIPHAIY